MRIPRTPALTVALALVLTSCADEDAPTDAAGDTDVEVVARNISFDPGTITVAAGTTVTFTNEDIVRHTVTSGEPGDPDGAFDEDLPDQGDTAQVTFDEPGTVVYHCDLHRDMTGEIVVE
jgi:plastocyanin